MSSQFSYQSDGFDRNAQRFIIPLYIKNELGDYVFSSTGTLAKYKGHHYLIFAAHALAVIEDFEDVHTFFRDGEFFQIREGAIGHQIFRDEDIVVVDYFNRTFGGKNYFDLELSSLYGFEKRHFSWTGFPSGQSNSKQVHRSKSTEALRQQYVHSAEDGIYFTNARYFTIVSRLIANNKRYITGKYDRKNINLKYAGAVSLGPHPKGMSGGAMYFFARKFELKERLDDTYRFAGIGIEYRKDNTIVGVSRSKIIELLDTFDEEHPVRFHIR